MRESEERRKKELRKFKMGPGRMVKLHNRRVIMRPVLEDPEYRWQVEFRRLGLDGRPFVTSLCLTDDHIRALFSLYCGMQGDKKGD